MVQASVLGRTQQQNGNASALLLELMVGGDSGYRASTADRSSKAMTICPFMQRE